MTATLRSRDPTTGLDADGDDCPNCDATLVNVQGLHACHDCAWVAYR
ncbi:MAG: hypothetical protein ABEJ34_05160 [Haloferacaceae archaeon]